MTDPLQGGGPHPLEDTPSSSPLDILVQHLGSLKTRGRGVDADGEALSPLGSDEDLEEPQRLVADPDSPTSRLLERQACRSLAASAQNTPEKFNYARDIARNPAIARAARHALSSSPGAGVGAGAGGGGAGYLGAAPPGASAGVQHLQVGHELDSLTAVVDQLDADAAEESRLNQEMARVTLGRLLSGRQAAERTLGVLQAFAAAENAYARAMSAVAKLSLCSDADGPTLRAAMEAYSDLPMLASTAHSSVAERLQEAIRNMQALVTDLRAACDEVVHGAGRAKREVESARHGLKAALKSHHEACVALEAASVARARPAGRGRAVDSDPWLTEGCLVEQQVRLQRAQHVERQYLAKAFQRVGDLERRRASVVQASLGTFIHIYRSALVPIQDIADELQELLNQIDAQSDLEAFTQTAASTVHSAEALSSRQREALDQICSELVGSGEILRQGSMERWNSASSKWRQGHLVLTRAGFLHFFLPETAAAKAAALANGGSGGGGARDGSGSSDGSKAGGSQGSLRSSSSSGQLPWGGADSWAQPLESINLSRCSFEQGEAPVFRIIEAGASALGGFALFSGRPRTQTLRAATVEECMDWAISIRETIAACIP